MSNLINFSTARVGGLRFVKLGRLTFSFTISREYKPLKGGDTAMLYKSLKLLGIFYIAFMGLALGGAHLLERGAQAFDSAVERHAERLAMADTFELIEDKNGNRYVLDYDLTREDCQAAMTSGTQCIPADPCNGAACNAPRYQVPLATCTEAPCR